MGVRRCEKCISSAGFLREKFIVGVQRCGKPTSSVGFHVKSILGRNLLCEFGVVKTYIFCRFSGENVFRKKFIVGVRHCENLHLLQVFR